jgi:hypothetical protein
LLSEHGSNFLTYLYPLIRFVQFRMDLAGYQTLLSQRRSRRQGRFCDLPIHVINIMAMKSPTTRADDLILGAGKLPGEMRV